MEERQAVRRESLCTRFLIPLSIIIVATSPLARAGDPDTTKSSVAPLVLVFLRSPSGSTAGTGFSVGDGSLVVTAAHLVAWQEKGEDSRVNGLVSVVSPYLGEACEPTVVAVDHKLDLAVLQTPWTGHPSYPMATERSIGEAEKVKLLSLARLLGVVGSGKVGPFGDAIKKASVQEEQLSIDFVAMRRHKARFLQVDGVGDVGLGWSGCPMLRPETGEVVGVMSRIHAKRDNLNKGISIAGAAITQVKRLLRNLDAAVALERPKATKRKAQPTDAAEAFQLSLECIARAKDKKFELVKKSAERLLKLRPKSAFAHLQIALAMAALKNEKASNNSFEKVIELNPSTLAGRVLYSQELLERGEYKKAQQILEQAWKQGGNKGVLAIAMTNVLVRRKMFEKSATYLRGAAAENPRNAMVWAYLGQTYAKSGKFGLAAEAYEKAVALSPSKVILRAGLAQTMQKAGRLISAENAYRDLVKRDPRTATWHFLLAQFLSKHRKGSTREALGLAEAALRLPNKGGPPREVILGLIRDLKTRIQAEQDR